jgi:hypothetical protein
MAVGLRTMVCSENRQSAWTAKFAKNTQLQGVNEDAKNEMMPSLLSGFGLFTYLDPDDFFIKP